MDITKRLGWKPPLPNINKPMFGNVFPMMATLPPSIDLRPDFPNSCWDQLALGSCHDSETEVLTNNGWKLFCNVQKSDKLAAVDPETKVLRFETPLRLIKLPHKDKIYFCDNKDLNFAVTADHKMLIKNNDKFKLVPMQNIENAEYVKTTEIKSNIEIKTVKLDRSQIREKFYDGYVYCAEVPTHTLVTRRKGTILVSGNCTAHGAIGVAQFLMKKQGLKVFMPSRLAHYYWTRQSEGNVNEDTGASVQAAMYAMATWGLAHESLWWYNINKYAVKPSQKVAADAKRHKVSGILAINQTENELKTCLAMGYPISFGFSVYESFQRITRNGIMPMPGRREQILGGHCVILCGYTSNMFICRNSWSPELGR